MTENLVAQGINYLKVMRDGNLNVHEVAEDLEVSIEHVKRCIKAARDRKEASKKGFETYLVQPKYYFSKGTSGEFQTITNVELEFDKSFTINYDTTKESEFKTLMPVIVRVKRH